MELLDLNAVIHLDLNEIDAAIEKVNRLLSLLQEVKKTAGSQVERRLTNKGLL